MLTKEHTVAGVFHISQGVLTLICDTGTKATETRMHSSRMRTTRLLTGIHCCTGGCLSVAQGVSARGGGVSQSVQYSCRVLKWTSVNRSPVMATRWGFHVWCPGLVMGQLPEGRPCTVRSNSSWVMVTWGPPCRHNDRQIRPKTLPYHKTSLAGGKNDLPSSFNTVTNFRIRDFCRFYLVWIDRNAAPLKHYPSIRFSSLFLHCESVHLCTFNA